MIAHLLGVKNGQWGMAIVGPNLLVTTARVVVLGTMFSYCSSNSVEDF